MIKVLTAPVMLWFSLAGIAPGEPAPTPGPGAPSAETAVVGAPDDELTRSSGPDAGTVTITVDWNDSTSTTSQALFSVAGFLAGNPGVASNPQYQSNLEFMGIGSLRYHTAESFQDSTKNPNGWLDYANQTWAASHIIEAVSAWHPEGVQKIVNILGWPSWMDSNGDGFLDKDQYEAFAAFCADLVRILNVEAELGIEYFEITNEKDGLYWIDAASRNEAGREADLAEIYLLAARAMKAVDPAIKTGGPSAMRPDRSEPLLKWAQLVQEQLDFLSVHMYASGNTAEPDIHIWDRTESFGKSARGLREALDAMSPDHHIELHVNEFNISWTWETREPRMVNHIGAVFDALAMVQLANAGVDMIHAWNECDGVYGKMDNAYTLRPSANVFHLFNEYLVGDVMKSASSRARQVVPFAVAHNGTRSLLLINRTDQERVVDVSGVPGLENGAKWSVIDAKGFRENAPLNGGRSISLSPESVSVIRCSP